MVLIERSERDSVAFPTSGRRACPHGDWAGLTAFRFTYLSLPLNLFRVPCHSPEHFHQLYAKSESFFHRPAMHPRASGKPATATTTYSSQISDEHPQTIRPVDIPYDEAAESRPPHTHTGSSGNAGTRFCSVRFVVHVILPHTLF